MTARVCPSCARPLEGLEQYRATVSLPSHAEHQMAERRVERRRAQWRDAKRRAYRPRPPRDGRVGAYHELSCAMPVRCTCDAIPAYPMLRRVS